MTTAVSASQPSVSDAPGQQEGSLSVLLRARWRLITLAAGFSVTVASSILVSQQDRDIAREWEQRRQVEQQRDRLVELSIRYPDYRDLLKRLAVVQWKLGADQAATDALTRAKYLDPVDQSGKQLEDLIRAAAPTP